MKKFLLFITSIIISLYSNAQAAIDTDTLLNIYNNHRFYNISDSSNNKLILFLHGGLNNPYFKQPYDQITLNNLIENNKDFITQASDNNFDLVIPITNDSLNWLDEPQESFKVIKDYIKSISKQYKEIYISGFSDGGTGSYKIFYTNPEYFSGLIVFNGYPQHSNFYKKIDYSSIDNRKIIFFSTLKDKNIPYEFLLTEYCVQKKVNANTYFYLTNGNHSFKNYKEQDFNELFLILTNQVNNNTTEPIQGFVKNDQVIKMYPFRKKVVKKYNFGKEVYKENIKQQKKFKE